MTGLLLNDYVEGIGCGYGSDRGISMAHKDNIFCGLFNDDAAITEYIVPMVKGLVKGIKSVRRLTGSSSYPST